MKRILLTKLAKAVYSYLPDLARYLIDNNIIIAQIFEVNSIAALNIEVCYHYSNSQSHISVYFGIVLKVR